MLCRERCNNQEESAYDQGTAGASVWHGCLRGKMPGGCGGGLIGGVRGCFTERIHKQLGGKSLTRADASLGKRSQRHREQASGNRVRPGEEVGIGSRNKKQMIGENRSDQQGLRTSCSQLEVGHGDNSGHRVGFPWREISSHNLLTGSQAPLPKQDTHNIIQYMSCKIASCGLLFGCTR